MLASEYTTPRYYSPQTNFEHTLWGGRYAKVSNQLQLGALFKNQLRHLPGRFLLVRREHVTKRHVRRDSKPD